MREFLQETGTGGCIVVLCCMLLLLCALLSLFRDHDIRIIGYLTLGIFGSTLIGTLVTMEVLNIHTPVRLGLTGHSRRGGGILLLWAFCSYKLARHLYYRYLS